MGKQYITTSIWFFTSVAIPSHTCSCVPVVAVTLHRHFPGMRSFFVQHPSRELRYAHTPLCHCAVPVMWNGGKARCCSSVGTLLGRLPRVPIDHSLQIDKQFFDAAKNLSLPQSAHAQYGMLQLTDSLHHLYCELASSECCLLLTAAEQPPLWCSETECDAAGVCMNRIHLVAPVRTSRHCGGKCG
jgi:hypothetical protein